jgi:hypothetical protein
VRTLLPSEEKEMGQYWHFCEEICNCEAIGIYVRTYRCCKSAKNHLYNEDNAQLIYRKYI